MSHNIYDTNIVLAVSGSIACYKAVDLASKLTQLRANVDVIMTEAAQRFVTPLTFRSITHRPVVTSMFEPDSELSINHVALAERADIVAVVPATANTLARIAHGMADDAITATVLATRAPLLVAPAMDANMFDSPATRSNVELLSRRGVHIAGPAEGRLASGLIGKDFQEIYPDGISPEEIFAYTYAVLHDPVYRHDYRVDLLREFPRLPLYHDFDLWASRWARVGSALTMRDALNFESANADAVVMAAAVADCRVDEDSDPKVKKGGADSWTMDLVKKPYLIAGLDSERSVKVGIAARERRPDSQRSVQAAVQAPPHDRMAIRHHSPQTQAPPSMTTVW